MPRVKSKKYDKVFFRCDVCNKKCCFGYKLKKSFLCACGEHRKEIESKFEKEKDNGK